MGFVLDAPPRVGEGMKGGRVTDPVQVEAIFLSVQFYSRPWWRRVGRTCPQPSEGVRAALPPSKIDMPSRVPSPSTGEAA